MACLESSSSGESSDGNEDGECLVELPSLPVSNLRQVLENILKEELVISCSLSRQICSMVNNFLTGFQCREVDAFSTVVEKQIQKCFNTGTGGGSIPMSRVWRNFHILRLSDSVKSAWETCIAVLQLPSDVLAVSDLTLQLILKRMFQEVVQQMTVKSTTSASASLPLLQLTAREENITRHMAGYVIVKMKKKYKTCCDFFQSIHVSVDEAFIETIQDYTKIWTEQIDRGGLYHVKDSFFEMIKEIELVCRKYLDITLTPTEDLIRKIKEDALNSQSITHTWDTIASSIQSDLSSKILNDIIKLWTNIRVHSFAERWTEKIGKGFKKSTRKTLKQKGTEKEN